MTSVCISNCINDARDPRIPLRATYVNLYKWPESDAEFIKTVRRVSQGMHDHQRPRVVDSVSCRQMYLRSYTFSRKESVPEKTKKCFGKVKEKVGMSNNSNSNTNYGSKSKNDKNRRTRKKEQKGFRRKKCLGFSKALIRIFRRLLTCAASVDVVDQVD